MTVTPPRLILPPDGMAWGRWIQNQAQNTARDSARLRSEVNNNQKATASTIAKLQQQVSSLQAAQDTLYAMRTYSAADLGSSPTYALASAGFTSAFGVSLSVPRSPTPYYRYKMLVTLSVNYRFSTGAAPSVSLGAYGGINMEIRAGAFGSNINSSANSALVAAPRNSGDSFSGSGAGSVLIATGIINSEYSVDPTNTELVLSSKITGSGNNDGVNVFCNVELRRITLTASIIEVESTTVLPT